MGNRVTRINIALATLLLAALAGSAHEAYQAWRIERLNQALRSGKPVDDAAHPYQQKFAAAYLQGQQQDYKHAVQSYGQLLEMAPDASEKARIQFNIGNNLFLSGLERRVNDDGSLKDEARYAFLQARMAYEQALRLDPESRRARFNLSLLHAAMPLNARSATKEQTGMELSNLPVGLP